MKAFVSLVVLLLGTATTAIAEPKRELVQPTRELAPSRAEASNGRFQLTARPRRAPPPVRPATGWVELASPTPTRHGTEFVMVGNDAFAALRVDNAEGKVIVTRVRVVFGDGAVTVLDRRAILDSKRKSFVVDLGDAKPIAQIEVTTETRATGQYTLHGSKEPIAVPRAEKTRQSCAPAMARRRPCALPQR